MSQPADIWFVTLSEAIGTMCRLFDGESLELISLQSHKRVLLEVLEAHQALVQERDQLKKESLQFEDGILRALDQVVGWCSNPTTDPEQIVKRMRAILEDALEEDKERRHPDSEVDQLKQLIYVLWEGSSTVVPWSAHTKDRVITALQEVKHDGG